MRAALAGLAVLGGCALYQPPVQGAGACVADRLNVYVSEGQRIDCVLQPGQRAVVVVDPQGRSRTALQIVCEQVFRGQFIGNELKYVFCALPKLEAV